MGSQRVRQDWVSFTFTLKSGSCQLVWASWSTQPPLFFPKPATLWSFASSVGLLTQTYIFREKHNLGENKTSEPTKQREVREDPSPLLVSWYLTVFSVKGFLLPGREGGGQARLGQRPVWGAGLSVLKLGTWLPRAKQRRQVSLKGGYKLGPGESDTAGEDTSSPSPLTLWVAVILNIRGSPVSPSFP